MRREIPFPDALLARLFEDTPDGLNWERLGDDAQANVIGQSTTFRQDCTRSLLHLDWQTIYIKCPKRLPLVPQLLRLVL